MRLDTLVTEIRLALRNVTRQRRRALLALATIIGGVVALLLAGGFIQWILDSMRESTIHSHLGHVQIVRPGFYEKGIADPYSYLLPKQSSTVESIERREEVQALAPRLVFSGLISHGDDTISFAGEGVDPEKEKALSRAMTIVSGVAMGPEEPNGILLGQGLAANLGVAPGDPVVLMVNTAQGNLNAVDARVVGLFATTAKAFDDGAIRVPIGLARQLVRVEGATSWVVLLQDTQATDGVVQSLRSTLPGGEFEVVPWHALADFYNKTVTLFSSQVKVVEILIGLIIILSITNTLSMAVIERTGEIGTAMALGVSRSAVLRQFVLEGLLLGMMGGLAGVMIGWLLAQIISTIGIPMPPPPGMAQGFIGHILVTPGLAMNALILAIATTFLASLVPAWKASRMIIVDALRHQR